jgi:hypothetical protein
MSAKHATNGKAFEWALALAFEAKGASIKAGIARDEAERCFSLVSAASQVPLRQAAEKAAEHILKKEPRLSPVKDVAVEVMPDSAGKGGDVRDLVLRLGNVEIGVSAKHNHAAVKHPRIRVKDGISSWLGGAAASGKWAKNTEKPYAWMDKHKGAKWRAHDQTEVLDEVLKPMALAVAHELSHHKNHIAEALLRYCIGSRDFYKVIFLSRKNEVQLLAFNLQDSLGRGDDGKRLHFKKTPGPKGLDKPKILGAGNTFTLSMDPWRLSFRLHTADTKITRAGLKFDINIVALPPNLYTHHMLIP